MARGEPNRHTITIEGNKVLLRVTAEALPSEPEAEPGGE